MVSTESAIEASIDELSRCISLEESMQRLLHRLCEHLNARAAVLTPSLATLQSDDTMFRHDPLGLLETRQFNNQDDGEIPSRFTRRDAHSSSMVFRSIALECAGTSVGQLRLCFASGSPTHELEQKIKPFDGLLALMTAAIGNLNGVDSLLNAAAFRQRIGEEMARARRHADAFCVLHLWFEADPHARSDAPEDAVTEIRRVATHLKSRLREGDIVGRLSATRLAILLPQTPPVGGRIALNRIEHAIRSTAASGSTLGTLKSSVRSFPAGAEDLEGLCRIESGSIEHGSPVLSGGAFQS